MAIESNISNNFLQTAAVLKQSIGFVNSIVDGRLDDLSLSSTLLTARMQPSARPPVNFSRMP